MSDCDRVGLAWRDELAAQIMLHLESIDHLEIIAEREWSASRRRLDALHDLAGCPNSPTNGEYATGGRVGQRISGGCQWDVE